MKNPTEVQPNQGTRASQWGGRSLLVYTSIVLAVVICEILLDLHFKDPTGVMVENSPLGVYKFYPLVTPPTPRKLPIVVDLDLNLPEARFDDAQQDCVRIGRLTRVIRKLQIFPPAVVAVNMVLPDGCPEVNGYLTALKDLLDSTRTRVVLANDLISYQDQSGRWQVRRRKLFRDTFRYCGSHGQCRAESSQIGFTEGPARIYADNRLLPIKISPPGGDDYATFAYSVANAAGDVPDGLFDSVTDTGGVLGELSTRHYARFVSAKSIPAMSAAEAENMFLDRRQAIQSDVADLPRRVVLIGAAGRDLHHMATGEIVPGYILQANYIHALMQNGQILKGWLLIDLFAGVLLTVATHLAVDRWGSHQKFLGRCLKCSGICIVVSIAALLFIFLMSLVNWYLAPFGVYLQGFLVQVVRQAIPEKVYG